MPKTSCEGFRVSVILRRIRWQPIQASYLDENQFVKKDTTSDIRQCDTDHDDNRSDHEALSPRFKDEAIGISRLRDFRHSPTQGWE
jgi:hypothetical protein